MARSSLAPPPGFEQACPVQSGLPPIQHLLAYLTTALRAADRFAMPSLDPRPLVVEPRPLAGAFDGIAAIPLPVTVAEAR